jgi:hypothetical protein
MQMLHTLVRISNFPETQTTQAQVLLCQCFCQERFYSKLACLKKGPSLTIAYDEITTGRELGR